MIPGFTSRLTSSGIPVLRVWYGADPKKRPGTPEGDEWLSRASSAYPGGMNSPRWRKEMEIDWGAVGGTRFFPQWEQWCTSGKILSEPFHPEGYKLYSSYDHGWRNPACYLVLGVNFDGDIAVLWEFYGSNVGTNLIAEIIKGKDIVSADGRRFAGNPYAGMETLKIADPSMWAEDQPMNDGTNKSVAELFRRCGVYFAKAERGGDTMVAEGLHSFYWKDPEVPRFRICCPSELRWIGGQMAPAKGRSGPGAPYLVWEMGRLRHKDVSAKVAINRDQPEQMQDKDNHAFDAMKQFFLRFPPKPMGPRAEKKPGTFNWWRELAKKGRVQRSTTFRA